MQHDVILAHDFCKLKYVFICFFFSIVRQVDGTLVKRYKHPGQVYGCDWSLNNRYNKYIIVLKTSIFEALHVCTL